MDWIQSIDIGSHEERHLPDDRSLQFEQSETTSSSNGSVSNCFHNVTSIVPNIAAYTVKEVVPLKDLNATNSSSINNTTIFGYTAQCNETELPDSMGNVTVEAIAYQYEIAWNRSNPCISSSGNTSMILDSTAHSVEHLLNDFLSQQLLQNCTFRQRYVQFYSISTLPFDQVVNPSVEPCSSSLASFSDDWDCVKIDGSLTVQTFYKSLQKNQRLLHSGNPTQRLLHRSSTNRLLSDNIFAATVTTFSDPVLGQKMGSLLVSFFNASGPSLFHDQSLQMRFLAITNFVSQDIPTWDQPSHNATGQDGTTSTSPEFRGPSISRTAGLVVLIITALALLMVTLGMIWHKRRQQRMWTRPPAQSFRRKSAQDSTPEGPQPAPAIRDNGAAPSRFYIVGDHDDDTIEVMSIGDVKTRGNPTPPIFISTCADDGAFN
jgi:hypothetical protein